MTQMKNQNDLVLLELPAIVNHRFVPDNDSKTGLGTLIFKLEEPGLKDEKAKDELIKLIKKSEGVENAFFHQQDLSQINIRCAHKAQHGITPDVYSIFREKREVQ